jgi:hypothetical protein
MGSAHGEAEPDRSGHPPAAFVLGGSEGLAQQGLEPEVAVLEPSACKVDLTSG